MTTEEPDPSGQLLQAVELLSSGKVVGIPTETVYGLAVDPRRDTATGAIFALKGRPVSVALPVLIADPSDAATLANFDDRARALARRYWPGPLTIVLKRRAGAHLHVGGDPASVGLRCPMLSLTRRLLTITGPLAVTSANRHGGPPARSAGEVRALFGDDVGLVLDGGRCDGEPSTVVSLVGDGLECLRQGSISMAEIGQVVSRAPRSSGRSP